MRREVVTCSTKVTRLTAALGLLRDLHRILEASNCQELERGCIKLAFDVKATIRNLNASA